MAAKEITYEIVKSITTIGEPSPKGWTLELNIVKWGSGAPKYDIRQWDPEHQRCGKGLTFTADQLEELRDALSDITIEPLKADTRVLEVE